jgi:AcrR family transcriptional regulator
MMGLRERKKLAVRQALSQAALRLAIERGVDNVRVEDIAAEADVAVRTFRNYFASKYEAMCSIALDRADRIGQTLRNQPPGQPLWDALANAMLQHYEGSDQAPDRERMEALRVVLTAPGVRGEFLRVSAATQDALAGAIADRTGIDPATDMYPDILAGAVNAATQVALRRWFAADPPVPLRPLLERALRQLAGACGQMESQSVTTAGRG